MEDVRVREFLKGKLKDAAVSRIEIERAANRVNVTIYTAKPGMVIGKGGSEVENLRSELTRITGGKKSTSTSPKSSKRIWTQRSLPKASLNSWSAGLRSAAP